MAPDRILKLLKNLPARQQPQMDLIKGYVASFITRLKPKRAQKKTPNYPSGARCFLGCLRRLDSGESTSNVLPIVVLFQTSFHNRSQQLELHRNRNHQQELLHRSHHRSHHRNRHHNQHYRYGSSCPSNGYPSSCNGNAHVLEHQPKTTLDGLQSSSGEQSLKLGNHSSQYRKLASYGKLLSTPLSKTTSYVCVEHSSLAQVRHNRNLMKYPCLPLGQHRNRNLERQRNMEEHRY